MVNAGCQLYRCGCNGDITRTAVEAVAVPSGSPHLVPSVRLEVVYFLDDLGRTGLVLLSNDQQRHRRANKGLHFSTDDFRRR